MYRLRTTPNILDQHRLAVDEVAEKRRKGGLAYGHDNNLLKQRPRGSPETSQEARLT